MEEATNQKTMLLTKLPPPHLHAQHPPLAYSSASSRNSLSKPGRTQKVVLFPRPNGVCSTAWHQNSG